MHTSFYWHNNNKNNLDASRFFSAWKKLHGCSPSAQQQVHEYWAQVALEFGDFKQFDQAAAQLEAKMLVDVTFIGVFS